VVFGKVLEGLDILARIGEAAAAAAAAALAAAAVAATLAARLASLLEPQRLQWTCSRDCSMQAQCLCVPCLVENFCCCLLLPAAVSANCCCLSLPADKEAASPNGVPEVDVTIADCGVL
jgi:hypothetical protein